MTEFDPNIEFLQKRVDRCENILKLLSDCNSTEERLAVLESQEEVHVFFTECKQNFNDFSNQEKIAVCSVAAIGQGANVFGAKGSEKKLKNIVNVLCKIEKFYDTLGGIIGYHRIVLVKILDELKPSAPKKSEEVYHQAHPFDILHPTQAVLRAIKTCLENLPSFGEMYPIGGAGDRLQLRDQETGKLLPAAMLRFCGRTLLEGLIRDIQAREFLYYKLFGRQLIIPVALMTSQEKNNHTYIHEICEENEWFGRSKEKFRLFMQPLVPVISKTGMWVMRDALELMLKPGGHGVLWKKASDEGIFDWFEEQGCHHLLVRQINNPVACTDYGPLALMGYGYGERKSFGISSCKRIVNTAEGMNVLYERKKNEEYEYCVTNIEYTEFKRKGVKDFPACSKGNYSVYPANTNIIFADIKSLREAIVKSPIPGMIFNMKTKFNHVSADGSVTKLAGGRLESTMQNIADVMVDIFPEKMDTAQKLDLKTFITYNKRRKTISVTKSSFEKAGTICGTPFGAFYEMLENYHELLGEYCGFELPSMVERDAYIKTGPSFIAFFHPAIGPCWEIVAQKLIGGVIADGAEILLELAEVEMRNIELQGSLLVEAKDPLGKKDANGIIQYGNDCGKCSLVNVKIKNKGINKEANNVYWSGDIQRHEALQIVLHGNAEFCAKNVTIEGDQFIEVPDGYSVTVTEVDGEIVFDKKKIRKPSWYWKYEFSDDNNITLTKCS
ncbi:MAG: UTP--glucose-1-phosphate uridylyltransferase [Chlamydiota bacterium]|nr:UTP--glucose-1-phosphate uridylyltransferase [Chlamydiota bacterium]